MRNILILILTTSTSFCYSQGTITDSLLHAMCVTIKDSSHLPDSVRIAVTYEKHLYPFFKGQEESKQMEMGDTVYFRLQRNCDEFHKILSRNSPQKGDWEDFDSKPLPVSDKKICEQFKKYKLLSYLEPNGDRVWVTIENNIWQEKFIDGTYSDLKFKWVSDCEFEIEFIKSNNQVRKSFSKPGDKYRYQIIDHGAGYYKLSVEVVGIQAGISAFKIYY